MKTTDTRATIKVGQDTRDWAKARYKAPKGRAVAKTERPTYDQAATAMLAGQIESWHIYEDGWTFTLGGVETPAMTLAGAKAFLDNLANPVLARFEALAA